MFNSNESNEKYLQLKKTTRMTRFGGDCYNYALLAMGQIDIIFENDLKSVDTLPLIPIIEGADGIATDWDGLPITEKSQNILVCATKTLHQEALKQIQIP